MTGKFISVLFALLTVQAQELPLRTLWKTYPVYHPEKAPPDYIEWLRTQAPEQITNPTGEDLYDAPAIIGSFAARPPSDPPFLHDKSWFDKINPPLTREGAITGLVYVLRTKGKVEIGAYSCAGCHNRVLPNGAVIKGANGNFPVDAALAEDLNVSTGIPTLRDANKVLLKRLFKLPNDNLVNAVKLLSGHPIGTMPPPGGDPAEPIRVPDIIGAQITPAALAAKQLYFDPASRFSNEQLAELSKYVASLKAPKSPYKPDKFTRAGEKVYQREGCAECHATANKLDGTWYRSILGKAGTITTLEEWLSPTRLQYSGGHEYGLTLNGSDRASLIAYLRTL